MCPKTKTKSRTSTKESSRKRECGKCTGRRVTEKQLNQLNQTPMPMPMHMMNQGQPGFVNYGYGYGYGDSTWEDNYPAMISIKQWRDHTQAAQNAYSSAQDNGKKIGEIKSAVTGDIRETQEAINETHDSVNRTDSHVRDTHNAIEVAHASIKSTHAAVLAMEDAMNDKHAEYLSKQEACAAEVVKVRQLLETEAKRREETHRVREMVRHAQRQGLLQRQAQAQPYQDRDRRSRSSQSSSPTISVSSGRSRADEEQRIGMRRYGEREREHDERDRLLYTYTEKWGELMDVGHRLQEQEQRIQARGELEAPRRKDLYAHYPRPRSAYYDDGIETPPYSVYSYAEHGVGPRGQLPRRGQPKRSDRRPWDN
ncbi:hypothetical protein F5Y03DRAFT_239662 [Xylaria venustula]|nr:hypothetical protein F5Y03DRAFT_239662 [Xylaria venustula]